MSGGARPPVPRLDFVLQTDLAEDLSGYANVLAAHKAYWFSRTRGGTAVGGLPAPRPHLQPRVAESDA